MVASSGYAGSSDGASDVPGVAGVAGLDDSIILVRREEAIDSGGVSDERRLARFLLRGGEVTLDDDEDERPLDDLTRKVGGAPAVSMLNGQCYGLNRAGRCS